MKPNYRVCEKCKHFELNKSGYKLAGICNLAPYFDMKMSITGEAITEYQAVVFMLEPPDKCPYILEHAIL